TSGGGGKSDAQREEEAAQRELENLQKQSAMLGLVEEGERRVSEEARVRWETQHGAYQSASAAMKEQLLAQAKALDTARQQREEQEKQKKELEDTERAYERLHDRLRTPVEAAVDSVTDQIETLNKALEKGIIDAKQYKAEIAKIGQQALSPLPNFRGDLYQFGIGSPDDDRLNEQLSELQSEYDQRRAIIDAALRQENADKQYWNQQSLLLEQQHQDALTNLAIAQNQLRLAQASNAFGSMASIAKSFAGEQSKTYQALFALSKGFAVAQAAVALAQNVAEASKLGWPANIGAIAAAMAQGAQIAQLLSSANYSPGGYAEGGYTGPGGKYQPAGIVHKGEGVLSQEDIRALGGPRGFHALRAAIHNGYADGGLVAPAPVYSMPEPRARISDSNAMQTSVNNKMRVYLLQNEDQLAQRLAQHPAMEKAVVAIAGQNGNSIRAEW
ncbi:MAG TPA: DNA-binding protein, partial [Pseudoxanthomonas sp.]|nr:DNA-binding protein [Pseudoxanthomonas sp.]